MSHDRRNRLACVPRSPRGGIPGRGASGPTIHKGAITNPVLVTSRAATRLLQGSYKPLQSTVRAPATLAYNPLGRFPERVLRQVLLECTGLSPASISVPWIAATVSATGPLEGEDGDSFIVPSSWTGAGIDVQPVLLIDRQVARLTKALGELPALVDAQLLAAIASLLDPYEDVPELIATEFTFHDGVGHSSGLPLEAKVTHPGFKEGDVQGLEELRADGVSFACCQRLFGPEYTARLFATNMVMRLGEDLRRAPTSLSDPHSNAALALITRGIDGGAWEAGNGKLRLKCDPHSLVERVYSSVAHTALVLTHLESQLLQPDFALLARAYRGCFGKTPAHIVRMARSYAGGNRGPA